MIRRKIKKKKKKYTGGARVLFFVKEDENCAYIENFEEFVRVHYHFLNIEGKSKEIVKL